MNRTAHLIVRICAAVALTTALTACDDDPESTAPSPTEDSAPPADDVQESSWEDETDPDLRFRGCLIGTFVFDRDAWTSGIRTLLERDGIGVSGVDDSGEATFALESDGTYTLIAEDSRTVTRGSSPGGEIEWLLTFDGTESGTWEPLDGQFQLIADAGGRIDYVSELSIDGQTLPADMLPAGGSPFEEVLAATCDADGVIAKPADDAEAIEVVLRRLD